MNENVAYGILAGLFVGLMVGMIIGKNMKIEKPIAETQK